MRRAALALLLALPVLGDESDRLKAFHKAIEAAKEPAARAAAVTAFAATWDAEAAQALLALVKPSESPDVLVALADATRTRKDPGATAILKASLALAAKQDWRARGTAAGILLARNAEGDFDLAMEASKDKDDRTLLMLCEGLGRSRHAQAVGRLTEFLAHEDWRVRAAAITALGLQRRSDPAVRALAERLRLEDGRLLGDLQEALTRLTGQELGPDPLPWLRWLTDKQAPPAKPAGNSQEVSTGRPPPVSYHGVLTYSRRILFVFDRTGSMKQDDMIGKEKRKLIEVIEGLGKEGLDKYEKRIPPVAFNILMFSNGDVEPWKEALVPATEENRKAAVEFINRQQAVGWTNTWTAMKAALDMAAGAPGRRSSARDRKADETPCDPDLERYGYGKNEADTIFLLSDGAPTKPSGREMDDWMKIASDIRDYNKTRRVVIHTIGIGEMMPEFMERVAKENGGTFSSVP